MYYVLGGWRCTAAVRWTTVSSCRSWTAKARERLLRWVYSGWRFYQHNEDDFYSLHYKSFNFWYFPFSLGGEISIDIAECKINECKDLEKSANQSKPNQTNSCIYHCPPLSIHNYLGIDCL